MDATVSQNPDVSVIIPVHNQERYVHRCLRSILDQSLDADDYEILVVDDGSTDRTAQALQMFEGDIRLIRHPECLGLPAALNTGIRHARGQFVVRLDSDDYVHREYLNALMLHLRLNPGMDAIACDYLTVDDHENVLGHVNWLDRPIGCSVMFRYEQLIDIGLYDEDFLAREDEDLRRRFMEKYSIDRVALPLYRYRRHDGNMTNDDEHMEAYSEALLKKHGRESP